jgi:hypothetical protein
LLPHIHQIWRARPPSRRPLIARRGSHQLLVVPHRVGGVAPAAVVWRRRRQLVRRHGADGGQRPRAAPGAGRPLQGRTHRRRRGADRAQRGMQGGAWLRAHSGLLCSCSARCRGGRGGLGGSGSGSGGCRPLWALASWRACQAGCAAGLPLPQARRHAALPGGSQAWQQPAQVVHGDAQAGLRRVTRA